MDYSETHFYTTPQNYGIDEINFVRTDMVGKHMSNNLHQGIHPDGKAWDKCCGPDLILKEKHGEICNCALTDGRIGEHSWNSTITFARKTAKTFKVYRHREPFICCHRLTEDGHTRVCAGWHALFGERWHMAELRKPFHWNRMPYDWSEE